MRSPTKRLESDEERGFYTYVAAWCNWVDVIKLEGRVGWPDRLLSIGAGRLIFMEFKRGNDGQLSDMQKDVHAHLRCMGCTVYTPRSKDEAIKQLRDELRGVKGNVDSGERW